MYCAVLLFTSIFYHTAKKPRQEHYQSNVSIEERKKMCKQRAASVDVFSFLQWLKAACLSSAKMVIIPGIV